MTDPVPSLQEGTSTSSGSPPPQRARPDHSRAEIADSEVSLGKQSPFGVELATLVGATALLVLPVWFSSRPAPALRIGDYQLEAPKIDIRRAPWYEWTLLEGIGEVRARRIVEHRRQQGGFRSFDDLEGVPGMPTGWMEKARPYLSASVQNRTGQTKHTKQTN